MKARRQMRIMDIVRRQAVHTQGELAEILRAEGIPVTQATLSRDIRELNLVKVPTPEGRARYSPPPEGQSAHTAERVRRYLEDSVLELDEAENLLLVKSLPGTAPAVASAIDALRWPEVAGTVAGDDTTLVVVRERRLVPPVRARLWRLAGREG